MLLPKIISVIPIQKYKLKVEFQDGTKGEYDVSNLAGKGVFKSWDADDNFFKVTIDKESGAITWPGGIDIDTLNAYCKIKGITPEEYLKNQEQYAAN